MSKAMARRVLIFILGVAIVVELGLACGGFFAPVTLLDAFKVAASQDTLFLADVIAWIVLAIGLVCALALKWVVADNVAGWSLATLLGVWWIAIGVGLYLRFGILENLVLDSVKGALIAAAAWKSWPKAPSTPYGAKD